MAFFDIFTILFEIIFDFTANIFNIFNFNYLSYRCNSKASYLPRQSLEKLNNSDPDHGSYKLTLTSNEDLVGHTKPAVGAYDILTHNGKLPNNLPDVLPLGAKLQSQPASPTSANSSPLRYSSNSNLSTTTTNTSSSPTHQQHSTTIISSGTSYSPMYPTQHRYSTPAMNYYNHNNNQAPSYTRSQSYDFNSNNSNTSPTKFMSQSTIDLKKTQHLETTLEETSTTTTTETSKVLLSPAQSENNLSSSANITHRHSVPAAKPQSPPTAQREFHRSTDIGGRTMSRDQCSVGEEGRIVRAELVNTTLPNSPNTGAHKTITRKDSLRENIEKITQLQSKLMSAHLSAENNIGILGTFSNKSSIASSQAIKSEIEKTTPTGTAQSDSNVEEDKPKLDAVECSTDSATPPMLPKTPPPQLDSYVLESTVSESLPINHISQMDTTTDGLKLMQRSELILRVNPLTVETASQTDDLPDSDMGRLTAENHTQHNKEDAPTRTTLQPRQRHPIELDCDTMSKELTELLEPNDKLIELLTPHIVKSSADYVSNLYNPNVPLRPTKRDVGTSTLMRMKTRDHQTEKVAEKPGIITVELQYAEIEVTLTNGNESDSCDMLKKKVDELIKQLNRKLKILNKEQKTIGEESAINDELGSSLVSKLSTKVRPIEATKFRTYIDDVGHITSLLLSLSERLAKSENTLSTIEENDAEKKLLESKRDRLMEQLEEAKRLKEDIDRRGSSVSSMLERNLTTDEFADFDFFINMKAKLIADSRDIADKIKCSEEQLYALSEALIQSDC